MENKQSEKPSYIHITSDNIPTVTIISFDLNDKAVIF